jgi:hypothetical protein
VLVEEKATDPQGKVRQVPAVPIPANISQKSANAGPQK